MEKSYRLILKNLSPSVNSDKISELFTKFGKVENVDLKERKNAWEDDKINRFAFVIINATDRNLNTCEHFIYYLLIFKLARILFSSIGKNSVCKNCFLQNLFYSSVSLFITLI